MHELIEIKFVTPKIGRGVFAKKDIPKDTVIEIADTILIPYSDYEMLKETIIGIHYLFHWDDPNENPKPRYAISTSPCEFLNHSVEPNATYYFDYENQTIIFQAIKDIYTGEEITINYNYDINDKSPMWFEIE